MRTTRMTMTRPQAEFFQLPDKYPLFCGGYGTGKTEALINSAFRDYFDAPTAMIGLYEPSYDLIKLILMPRLEERLTELKIAHRLHKTDKTITLRSKKKWNRNPTFIMRTLDNPSRIVGYQTYRAHVDEIDVLKKDQAQLAWRKIIARNRQKPKGVEKPFNRVSAYTTPEGFKFAYETWVKNKKEGYAMVQASTYSNPFLADDYIPSLIASYPPQLIKAYIDGEFTNLTSGSVYPDFKRDLNHSPTTMQPGEPLHIGMDFNVLNMAAIIFVVREDKPHAVAEITKGRDTPTVAALLKERYAGHDITIYPDASGQNTSSKSASESDLSILESHGFRIDAPSKNPPVKDRLNSVNALILNGKGERKLRVNTDLCPEFTECLEQQPYDKNGEPDKDGGHDHANDGAGYFLHTRWPLLKPNASVETLRLW